jgi:hypothetical protein
MNGPVAAAVARVGLQRYDIGRFEIYLGDGFERSCGNRLALFRHAPGEPRRVSYSST